AEDGIRDSSVTGVQTCALPISEFAATNAADLERRRIAQETHDIVGHALNVMLLQAGAARRVIDEDTDRTRELLRSLEAVGRDARSEERRVGKEWRAA